MGMYTELFLQVNLKKETPEEVIKAIEVMIGTSDEDIEPPFKGERWDFMLRQSSHYHFPFSVAKLEQLPYLEDKYFLFVRCDFKNYDGELSKFLEWLAPWVCPADTHYQGHHMYEECEEPTRIVFTEHGVEY